MTRQYRFPVTKKRRIRNKWSKRPINYKPREDVFYDEVRRIVYAHPMIAQRIREELNSPKVMS